MTNDNLWRVTIEYTGRRIFDVEANCHDEAIDTAKDCFSDECYHEKITRIDIKKFPIFSKDEINKEVQDAMSYNGEI